MSNKLKRIFNPTPQEKTEDIEKYKKIAKELEKKKGCSTCGNIRRVHHYPGFVIAEECECDVGLECDTVLFSVENCPYWTRAINK